MNKTREQQEKDFKIIKECADPNCKYCFGTGKEYWLTELKQYKPCECVLKNIKILRERGLN